MSVDRHPFNLTVSVYEMLFGADFVAEMRLTMLKEAQLEPLEPTGYVISSLRLKSSLEWMGNPPPMAAVRKTLSQMDTIAKGDVLSVLVDGGVEQIEVQLWVDDIQPAAHDAASISAVAWSVTIQMVYGDVPRGAPNKTEIDAETEALTQQLLAMPFEETHIATALSEFRTLYGDVVDINMEVLASIALEHSQSPFPSPMSAPEVHQLQIGDKVDHRDKVGRWLSAEVKDKKPGRMLIHYTEWADKWDEWSDLAWKGKAAARFAKHGSISERAAHRMLEVDVNHSVRYCEPATREWVVAQVVSMDANSGQVRVAYQQPGGSKKTDEMGAFG